MRSEPVLQFSPYLGQDEYEAIRDCFDLNWLTEGPKSQEFLDVLRELMSVRYACFAPNGTLALYLALRALGIGPGDEVVVPDFTFFGSASAVEMTGARPVFCDIDRDSLQVKASNFETCITSRTRALMPVHIYGMTCDMAPIIELAQRHSLKVIEDAAQALGVSYRGQHAGTFGDIATFSFFADKTVTTGEGGLVVTNDEELQQRLLRLRNQGRINRGSFIHETIGYNFRMTDIQAAIGLVQLRKLDDICKRKSSILAMYRERLDGIPQIRFIDVTLGSTYIPFRIAIFAERAHELMKYMEKRKIETRTFFYPLHKQPAFQQLSQKTDNQTETKSDDFVASNYAYDNGLCLPTYPGLPKEDVSYVCDQIIAFYKG